MKSYTNLNILTIAEKQRIILALLKADLLNKKLISGLVNAGLTIDDFSIDLLDPLYELIGFEKEDLDDDLDSLYVSVADSLCNIELEEFFIQHNSLAIEFYAELLAEKKLREKLRMESQKENELQ